MNIFVSNLKFNKRKLYKKKDRIYFKETNTDILYFNKNKQKTNSEINLSTEKKCFDRKKNGEETYKENDIKKNKNNNIKNNDTKNSIFFKKKKSQKKENDNKNVAIKLVKKKNTNFLQKDIKREKNNNNFSKIAQQNVSLIRQKKSRNKIVIPKKNVKKACCRNKIRRQIRAILHEKNIKNCFIKYDEKNNSKPKFDELKQAITTLLIQKSLIKTNF